MEMKKAMKEMKFIIATFVVNSLINNKNNTVFLYYGILIALGLVFKFIQDKGLITKKFWKTLALFYFLTIITIILFYFLNITTTFNPISQLILYYITLALLAVISYFIVNKFFDKQ